MAIILLTLLLLLILFVSYISPLWTSTIPETIKEAKRYSAFIKEYEPVNYIIVDTAYQNIKFNNVFLTKYLYVKENILGMRSFLWITFLKPYDNGEKYLRLTINNNDKLNTDNFLQTWIIQSNNRSSAGLDTEKIFIEFDYSYTENDSIEYTIYLMKIPWVYSEENLIPVLKFKLVPKNEGSVW
ncbi:MAG: hypothetical protein LBN95_04260 [Prevotellaceae bacterium]|nr:hypothetical protein [Prevotellaceae bacterium]